VAGFQTFGRGRISTFANRRGTDRRLTNDRQTAAADVAFAPANSIMCRRVSFWCGFRSENILLSGRH
jgi:hypothetical protein